MMLANDEPTQPTMREQIEGLIQALWARKNERMNNPAYSVEYIDGAVDELAHVIERLRYILDSEN